MQKNIVLHIKLNRGCKNLCDNVNVSKNNNCNPEDNTKAGALADGKISHKAR